MTPKRSHPLTLFEIQDYRLTTQELARVKQQLQVYRTGFIQSAALFFIGLLMRLKLTWPLAWATFYHSSLRGFLGLR